MGRWTVTGAVLVLVLGLALAGVAFVGPDRSERPSSASQVDDSGNGEHGTREDAERRLDWRFERKFVVGGADAGPASFYRISRSSVVEDGAGRIHVLDASAHRLVTFDSVGHLIGTTGGPGGGPGELDEPGGVALEPGGVLTVMDFGKRGLVRYDTSGRALPTRRLDVPYSGDRIAGTERGLVFTTLRGYRGEDRKVEDRLVLLTGEDSSEVVATLRKERPRMVDYSGCVRIPLPPLFEREIVWDARGDRIVWQVGERYRITVLEADGDRLSLRRRTPVREIDRETALAQLGEGSKVTTPEGTCRLDPEEQLEGRGFHSTLPPLERLVLTPSGGVWAVRYALRGEEPAVDVFDPEGRYVGTLPPGTPVPVVFLSADTFLAEETDEVGVERLVSYRILRRG